MKSLPWLALLIFLSACQHPPSAKPSGSEVKVERITLRLTAEAPEPTDLDKSAIVHKILKVRKLPLDTPAELIIERDSREKAELLDWALFKEQVLAEFAVDEDAIRSAPPAKRLSPAYPFGAPDRGKSGDCELVFTVGEDGRVSEIYLVSSAAPSFAANSEYAIRRWKFEPAAVRQIYRARFDFTWDPPSGAFVIIRPDR